MQNSHENTLNQTVQIAAWEDGFWIDDIDEAKDCDSAGSFEGEHKVIEVPADCSEEVIQKAIRVAFNSAAEPTPAPEVFPTGRPEQQLDLLRGAPDGH